MVKIKETTLIKVNNKSDSLRTTIPREIIKLFELQEGSKIEWFYSSKNRVSIEVPRSSRNKGGGGNV
jgi:bifunctional DNA-binding transcriptional regulator/antitoxin component of YhaV-PrlF toxin-antitoxin module